MSGSYQKTGKAATGRAGEDAACLYLERHGCEILARNWRANPGEVDIVALCPAQSSLAGAERELSFVEVRTRRGREGLSEESVTGRKAANMVTAAYAYMEAHGIDPEAYPWRIDLVAVQMPGTINWVRSALSEDMLG